MVRRPPQSWVSGAATWRAYAAGVGERVACCRYKDEGDKHFEFGLRLDGVPGKDLFGTHERVPIHITLMYEGGKIVEDQHSLLECLPPAPVMELREKKSALKIRVKEVSSRHRHQVGGDGAFHAWAGIG